MCVFRIDVYEHTCTHLCIYVCVCVWYPSTYISAVGVEGPTLDVSRLYAHAHMKRFGMC